MLMTSENENRTLRVSGTAQSGSSGNPPVLKFKIATEKDGCPYTPILALDGGGLRGIITGTSAGALASTYLSQKGSQANVLNDAAVLRAAQVVADLKSSIYKLNTPFQPVTRPGAAASLTAVFVSKAAVIFPQPNVQSLRRNINNFLDTLIPSRSLRRILNIVVCLLPRHIVRLSSGIFGARYPSNGIDAVLQAAYGSNFKLSQCKPGTSLLTVSYDVLHNRPIVFFFDATAEKPEHKSGFATMRRYLTNTSITPEQPVPGTFSGDIVRCPQDFYLWQTVRASSAAPTFFPSMSTHTQQKTLPICMAVRFEVRVQWLIRDPLSIAEEFTEVLCSFKASCGSLVAMTFALSIYKQKLEQVSSLSIGSGNSNQLISIPQNAGLAQWGVNLVTVLMGGPAELMDAFARQIATGLLGGTVAPAYITAETPVNQSELERRNHFRRIQISTDEIVENNVIRQIVAFNGIRMNVEQFLDKQTLSAPLQKILSVFDEADYVQDLVKIGYLLAKHPTTREILQEFTESFLLENPNNASIS